MKTNKWLALLALGILFISCSNDDDNPEQIIEEEVITTMTVTLTPSGGGTAIVLQTIDLDGDGPNAPVITVSDDLSTNTTYSGSIELLNETETPAEDITEEIEELAEEHQFFFTVGEGLNASVAYGDTEADYSPNTGSYPVGLSFTLATTDASAGSLTITLRHEPNKGASGVSNGDITNAGGSSDIAQSFDLTIE